MQGQASKVSRGLRTIGNNIAGAAKKSKTLSFAVGDGTKSVSLFSKKTGDMRSTYQVFTSINKYWGQMSKSQKTNLALTLAG